ncbi:MAG: tetratricopeptide repeat protein [Thermogutta sp.]
MKNELEERGYFTAGNGAAFSRRSMIMDVFSNVPVRNRLLPMILGMAWLAGCRPAADSSADAVRPPDASARGSAAAVQTAAEPIPYPVLPDPLTGDWMKAQAEAEASRLAEAFADDVEALDLQATVHRMSGRNDEAVEIWRRCLELRPGFIRAYVPMISVARRKGDYPEAERLGRECLRLDPLQVEARGLLAAVLFEQGRYDAAIEAVLAGQAIGAVNAEALFFQGQALQKKQEHERAVTALREAIRLEPNYTRAYYALSVSLSRLGRKEEADQARAKFRELQGRDMAANAAILQVESEAFVRRTVASVFQRAGEIWANKGRVEDAERCWLFAAVLVPDDPAPRLKLGTLYQSTNRPGLVRGVLDELGPVELRDPKLLHARGLLFLRSGVYDAAERDFLSLLEMTPQSAEAFSLLAQTYLTMGGKNAEALRAADAAVRLAPTKENLLVLAVACAETGDRDSALRIAGELLQRDPQSPEAHRLYEMLRGGDR